MSGSKDTYQKFNNHMQRLADVLFSSAVLQWDQETYMPEKGAEMRARQLATLSGLAHQAGTDAQLGKWLEELNKAGDLTDEEKVNVHHANRDFTIRKKYTTEFVEKMSRTVSAAFQNWHEAKTKNNFSLFAPHLEKLLELKFEECELLGYKHHPYDALLDQYEPGLTVAQLEPVFDGIRKNLKPVIDKVIAHGDVRDDFMFRKFEMQKQWDFGMDLLKQMGYDFSAGRQDKSSHPFTIHFNAHDVRVTTRIDENNLHEMIWSCIHEGGHALYEQGLQIKYYGLGMAEAVSLSIHESQSRLWENNVGRSRTYWEHNYPAIQQYFPNELKDVTLDEFYKAMNKVTSSLIRTNADELTYHFHVLIRYEIEKALLEKKLKVKDLPEYWNAKYKEYLNIDVPSDSKGVLQDVHWSHGSFGYFPTYSLGSFYAAQFFETAGSQVTGLEENIRKGNLQPLLDWLRTNIHQHGKKYSASELCKRITGKELDPGAFITYAKNKYGLMLGITWK
jgi:carboxypeptidase Taq